MNDSTKTQIHHSLKEATVKIFAEGKFQGSGFFVTPTGYLVTAYHCVAKPAMKDIHLKPMPQELYKTLEAETSPKVRWPAEVDKDKSLPNLDIAVLKVSHYEPTVCLPVGRLPEQWEGDEVVGCGCPGGEKPGMDKIATYPGIFTRILTDDSGTHYHPAPFLKLRIVRGTPPTIQGGPLLSTYNTQRNTL